MPQVRQVSVSVLPFVYLLNYSLQSWCGITVVLHLSFLSALEAPVDNYVPMYTTNTRGQEDIALLTINSDDVDSCEGEKRDIKPAEHTRYHGEKKTFKKRCMCEQRLTHYCEIQNTIYLQTQRALKPQTSRWKTWKP